MRDLVCWACPSIHGQWMGQANQIVPGKNFPPEMKKIAGENGHVCIVNLSGGAKGMVVGTQNRPEPKHMCRLRDVS